MDSSGLHTQGLDHLGIVAGICHQIGLHGAYVVEERDPDDGEADEPILIEITHGYSRDHCPDLKQAVLSMICANSANLPTLDRGAQRQHR